MYGTIEPRKNWKKLDKFLLKRYFVTNGIAKRIVPWLINVDNERSKPINRYFFEKFFVSAKYDIEINNRQYNSE